MRLILTILLLGSILDAGETAPAESEVRQIMRALPPRTATLKLIEIIRTRREDLAESSVALVELVRCYQLMREQSGIAQEYAEVMPKYLSKPPPLDGTSLPTLAEAGDDLLWRSWTAQSANRYVLRLRSAKREKDLDAEGTLTRKVQLRFDFIDQDAAPDASDSRHGFFGNDIRAPQADERGSPCIATAGTATFHGTFGLNGSTAWASFDDIPDTVGELDLAIDLRLSRPSIVNIIEVPLRDGETWQVGEAVGRLSAVVGGPTLNLQLLKAIGKPGAPATRVSFALSGGKDALPGYDQVSLLTAEGHEIDYSGCGSNGSDEQITMNFDGLTKPAARLRFTLAGSRSSRLVPLKVTGIKLP